MRRSALAFGLVLLVMGGCAPSPALAQEESTTTTSPTSTTTTTTTAPPSGLEGMTYGGCSQIGFAVGQFTMNPDEGSIPPELVDDFALVFGQDGMLDTNMCALAMVQGQVAGAMNYLNNAEQGRHEQAMAGDAERGVALGSSSGEVEEGRWSLTKYTILIGGATALVALIAQYARRSI